MPDISIESVRTVVKFRVDDRDMNLHIVLVSDGPDPARPWQSRCFVGGEEGVIASTGSETEERGLIVHASLVQLARGVLTPLIEGKEVDLCRSAKSPTQQQG